MQRKRKAAGIGEVEGKGTAAEIGEVEGKRKAAGIGEVEGKGKTAGIGEVEERFEITIRVIFYKACRHERNGNEHAYMHIPGYS